MGKIRDFGVCLAACSLLYANPIQEGLKEKVVAELPSLEGWCTKEKAREFIDFIFEEQPEIWVEIGVFGGSSLFPVLSAFQCLDQGIAIAIDPWDKMECIKYYDPIEDKADFRWWGKLNLNQIYSSFLNMLKQNAFEPYCTVIRASSQNAIEEIDSIDVLHIDGNHSEAPSLKDVELYLPKVKSGGYIWMNDSLWRQRQEAVELLLTQCDVVKLIDNGNCILFRKKA